MVSTSYATSFFSVGVVWPKLSSEYILEQIMNTILEVEQGALGHSEVGSNHIVYTLHCRKHELAKYENALQGGPPTT